MWARMYVVPAVITWTPATEHLKLTRGLCSGLAICLAYGGSLRMIFFDILAFAWIPNSPGYRTHTASIADVALSAKPTRL